MLGLASFTARVLREGGAGARSGEEIDRILDGSGATVEFVPYPDALEVSAFALREDFLKTLEILADMMQRPTFSEEAFESARVFSRSGIARQNDNIQWIASREFAKLLYGPDSPYARRPTYADIDAIRPEDVTEFHQRYFVPEGTVMALWGDFSSADARRLVRQLFGTWQGHEPTVPEVAAPVRRARVALVRKSDINQSAVRIGHTAARLDHPDNAALQVLERVLTGGGGRLFRRIREELGLAYAVSASWWAGYEHPGVFTVTCNTKSETTVYAIREVIAELRAITDQALGEAELRTAKDGLLNSFVFRFDTTKEVLQRRAQLEYYGYPEDFMETYRRKIEKLTAPELLRVAREHFDPDRLAILVVGKDTDFGEPLSALGEVEVVDVSVVPPEAEE